MENSIPASCKIIFINLNNWFLLGPGKRSNIKLQRETEGGRRVTQKNGKWERSATCRGLRCSARGGRFSPSDVLPVLVQDNLKWMLVVGRDES